MTSELKVDKVSPATGTSTTLGDTGDTFTVPSGVTLDTSSSTLSLPSSVITGQTEKTSLVDADKFLVSDSAASGALKYVQKSNLGAGGLVYVGGLVSTSAAAYYQVDNVFTATYSRYLVTFKIVPVTTGAGIDLQFRTSAPGTLDASEYEYSLNGFDSSNNSTFRDGVGTTTVQLTHGVNNDTSRNGMVGVMYFSEPDSGDRCVVNANYMYLNDSAVLRTMIGSITYKATGSAIAGFQFAGTGGTANDNIARGSIRVYGIVDS